MGKAADVTIGFNADTSPFVSNVKKGGAAARGFKKDVTDAGSALDQLKGGLGRSSALTQGLKILSGGGAILGLGLASKELAAFSSKFTEIKDKMAAGGDGGQLTAELLKSLPIVGSLGASIANIRAEIDGSADAVRKVTSETAGINGAADYALKRFEAMRDTTAGLAGQLRAVRDETALLGKRPEEQERMKAETGRRDELEKARANRDADRKKLMDGAAGLGAIDAEYAKKLQALRDAKEDYDKIGTGGINTVAGSSNAARLTGIYGTAKGEFEAAAARRASANHLQDDLTAKELLYQETVTAIEKKYGMTRVEIEKAHGQQVAAMEGAIFAKRLDAARSYQEKRAEMEADRTESRLRFEHKDLAADGFRLFNDSAKQRQGYLQDAGKQIGAGADPVTALMQAVGLGAANKAGRDEKLEQLWKKALADKVAAFVGGLPEKPGAEWGPKQLAAAAARGLFGVDAGVGDPFGQFDKQRPGLAAATERRFDFTIPGANDPQATAVRDQAKRQELANKLAKQTADACKALAKRKSTPMVTWGW